MAGAISNDGFDEPPTVTCASDKSCERLLDQTARAMEKRDGRDLRTPRRRDQKKKRPRNFFRQGQLRPHGRGTSCATRAPAHAWLAKKMPWRPRVQPLGLDIGAALARVRPVAAIEKRPSLLRSRPRRRLQTHRALRFSPAVNACALGAIGWEGKKRKRPPTEPERCFAEAARVGERAARVKPQGQIVFD